jgi:hypothetical protein
MKDASVQEPPKTRIARMSNAMEGGRKILEHLQSSEVRQRLAEAAERGVPPVTAVSATLLKAVGAAIMGTRIAKQFTGLAISSILEEAGFVPDRSGVRIRADGVFSTGAVYRKRLAQSDPAGRAPILQRILDALNPEERRWAARYLAELETQQADLQDVLNETEG